VLYVRPAINSVNIRLAKLDQFRRHFLDAVLLCMFGRFQEHFLLRRTPYDEFASARRIDLGAFENLFHTIASFFHRCTTSYYTSDLAGRLDIYSQVATEWDKQFDIAKSLLKWSPCFAFEVMSLYGADLDD
jgi:hypothetical protein